MVTKQLIVAIEGTAAIGPFWKTIVSDYLDKIVRCFCGNEPINSQKLSPSHVELSIVMFNAHGSYSGFLVQRSGWTSDMDIFFQWLSAIPFAGGGFSDVAIAEGLAEALMMFSSPNGSQNQNLEGQRHCILVAASNPYPLPTPVYRPQHQNLEKNNSIETQPENHLFDAETLAKLFAQSAISLSVICPKQLPKLRGIYNAGKRNPQAADPPVDNLKNPHFLILISENFMEACSCLIRSGVTSLPSNQNPVKADVAPVPSVSGPPPVPSANGTVLVWPKMTVGNVPPATVKVEPGTVTSVPRPTFSHISSVPQVAAASLKTSSPLSTSQDMTIIPNKESIPDIKPLGSNLTPSLRPVGPAANVRILNDVAQARQVLAGGTSIGVSSMGTPVLSNMISSGMPSSVPPTQTIISSGPTSISGSSPVPATGQVAQNSTSAPYMSAASNLSGSSSLPMSQPSSNTQNVGLSQTLPGVSQGSLPVSQMLQAGTNTNQNIRNGSSTATMPSGSGTMMPTPGISQQGQQGMQPAIVSSSNSVTNMPLTQQASSVLQPPTKYVKMWEGNLSGQRQGQPVFITKLEGYRNATSSETLAANWPTTMQIVRLISQDHMNSKQHAGKGDYLVFRAVNQHGFLGQLQEKKLCAVIQLPSQTLLLSVSDKAHRLIGVLFPGDMVVFKPQIPNQLQQQQQQQLQAQMQHQQQAAQMQQQQQNLHQQQVQMQQQQQNLHQQQVQIQQQQQNLHQQQQNLHHHRPQQQQPVQQLQQSLPLQQMQQQQQQPHPQIQQQRPLMQQQAQQQMVTAGMNQAYIQGHGRSQLLPQGQTSSQGSATMSGGSNFMG